MSITPIGAVSPPPAASLQSHTPARSGPAFAISPETHKPEQAGSTAAFRAPNPLSATMLAMQEVGPGPAAAARVSDREARRRGRDVLAALSAIQRDLLDTGNAEATLMRLQASLGELAEPEDPGLAGILGSIRLRAGIESIRLERTPKARTPTCD